jgi:hypothetical protein
MMCQVIEFMRCGNGHYTDIAIKALQQVAPDVDKYLSSIDYNTFAFAHPPLPRFGHDTVMG